jgi:hypothetical protein
MPVVERREQAGLRGDTLRRAEEQMTARPQGVVEGGQDTLLQTRLEVDHQVAAGDQVEARERRILAEVVRREQAQLADVLGYAI